MKDITNSLLEYREATKQVHQRRLPSDAIYQRSRMNELEKRDHEWRELYAALSKALSSLGTENAYGEGDYWLVDDDYGDTAQKVCVHALSFLRPEVIAAIQAPLKRLPHWRVLVQVDVEVGGVPASSGGLVIDSTAVKQQWDKAAFADLPKKLRL